MQSLPWVQKAGGLFNTAATWGSRLGRHPQWVGALAKGRTLQTAGRVAMGAGRLALGAGKLAFRGLASPIMIGIDALCGFLATQGGKWWQRLAGMLLKIVTLGFMSDKKVRQIVGMEEKGATLQQQANNDEERRHQERIGWWTKFWAWLTLVLAALQILLILVSWIVSSATQQTYVHSLLSSEGIRWFMGRFSENLATPVLVWLLVAAIAYGVLRTSGLAQAIADLIHGKRPSYRQRFALTVSMVLLILVI